jgi:putative alpha-1,2-mannosidase
VIKAKNNSRANKYVATVKLNGKTLDKMFINHQDIIDGGVLEFEMTASPTVK